MRDREVTLALKSEAVRFGVTRNDSSRFSVVLARRAITRLVDARIRIHSTPRLVIEREKSVGYEVGAAYRTNEPSVSGGYVCYPKSDFFPSGCMDANQELCHRLVNPNNPFDISRRWPKA